MTQRQQVTWISILLAIILGLLPVSIAITYAYFHTVTLAKDGLQDIAKVIKDKTDTVFYTIHAELNHIDDIDVDCQQEDIRKLRKLVFQLPIVGEVGLINKQGYLVCSSTGKLTEPIQLPGYDQQPGYNLVGPIELAHIQEEILVEDITREDGSSISVFIMPKVLMNGVAHADLGQHGFVAIIRPHDQHIYAKQGTIPNIDITIDEHKINNGIMGYRMQFADGIERFIVAVKSQELDHVWVVSAVPKAWILAGWHKLAFLLGLVGLLVSVALVSLVIFLVRRRLSLPAELSRAIQRNELVVYYQPVVDLKTRQCVGAEALLRWQHPEQALVSPDLFIPLAETTGLIEPMTEWLLQQVCDDLGVWLADNSSMHIAINLSQQHFKSERILYASESVFANSHIHATQLVYEITERGLVSDDVGMARHVMTALRKRGSAIALDDFGTGYSSLSYLGSFSLDYLKIDKQFVDAIGKQAVTTHLVDAIIQMAKQLNLKLIAEGVETQQQADYLMQHGVEYAQGWLFAKALPRQQFLDWVKQYS